MTRPDTLEAVTGCLPDACHLPGQTTMKERGIGCRFTGSPGEFRLFHADHAIFRTALGLEAKPGCDYLLVWRRGPARSVHVTGIELKGNDLIKGADQLASTVLAVRRARRGATARDSALLIYHGTVPDPSWQQKIRELKRQNITLRRKSVPKGKSVDLADELSRIERP